MYKPVLFSFLLATAAFAQIPAQPAANVAIQLNSPGELGPVNLSYIPFMVEKGPVVGAPYSAQSTTERVQMLADGNRIEQTTTADVARDSQGRVRNERVLSGVSTSQGEPPRLITIEDPVAGVTYTLDANTKTAFSFPAHKVRTFAKGDGGPALQVRDGGPGLQVQVSGADVGGFTTSARIETMAKGNHPSDENVVKTDLGMQDIEGVLAQGTRITKTIRAGEIGNEQPIVITTETWYSPDLKVLVMSKSSDPRIGETTYQLTNIQRSEPSPSLFQVPGDYVVKTAEAGHTVVPAKSFFFQK
jgi:hypothetical protein